MKPSLSLLSATALLFCLIFSTACGSSTTPPVQDGGWAEDGGLAPDGGARDDGGPMPDGGDPYAGRPKGQCTVNTDCPVGPQGQMCTRTAPGGICSACGTALHCPPPTICSQYQSCAYDCTEENDCPPGMTCAGNNLCKIVSCSGNVCPVNMFGCSAGGLCQRVDCSDGGVCPPHTTCKAGLCIENRAL